MTIRHFKIFVTVCDTMHMTMAAERLFMSQSAVSQAVGELERHYDVKLFERLSRKLYLTQAGKRLESYARHIIRMNDEAEQDMKTLHAHSDVRIGASVTVGAYVLPGLAKRFQEIAPNVGVKVVEDNTEQTEKLLLSDRIDLGLVEGTPDSSDLVQIPFLKDELVLICGAEHPFARHTGKLEQEALEREDYIVREIGSGTRKTFEEEMTAHRLHWKAAWTCNNADTIKMAAMAGLGISVISRRAVAMELDAGKLMEIGIKDLQFWREFKIVYHRHKYLTESMKQLIQLCLVISRERGL